MKVGLICAEEDNSAFDTLLATLEEMEQREQQSEAERLRALGAPLHTYIDLSDADPLWVQHDCVSGDNGTCAACDGYVAAGGVLW